MEYIKFRNTRQFAKAWGFEAVNEKDKTGVRTSKWELTSKNISIIIDYGYEDGSAVGWLFVNGDRRGHFDRPTIGKVLQRLDNWLTIEVGTDMERAEALAAWENKPEKLS